MFKRRSVGPARSNPRKYIMTSAIRFGLIGYGAWGGHHAQAIRQAPGAELAAIAVRSEASQQKAREDFPTAKVYGDYREMLSREQLDAVDIVLPSYLHFEAAEAVLQSGRHLLLEKPMCMSLEHCDRLIALAKEKQRLLAIGHELRLSSLWATVKQLVDDGHVGEPRYVLVELSRRPYRQGAEGWRYDIERVGDWILEEPIHFFDLARWYMGRLGEPTQVTARASSRQPGHPELQDNFSALLDFPGGGYGVVTQTLAAFEHHQTVKLTGTEGALWASWSGALDRTLHPTFGLKKFRFEDEAPQEVKFDKMTGEVFELQDQAALFVQAVHGEKQLAATGDDGRWSVGMCLAAQQSVQEGGSVSLKHLAGR